MNEELIALLAEVAMADADDISGEDRLSADLSMSATDVYELINLIEDEMGITVEDYDVDDLLDMTVEEFCGKVLAED